MSIFSLFAGVVFAAETVLSPIPDNAPIIVPEPVKPEVSFGQITQVLGETIEATPSPTPPLASSGATPTPKPVVQTKQRSYTIAFLGDSMIDTMGPGLPAVKNRLTNIYGATDFTLLNYGVGATNIEYGIERITNGYTYLGNNVPSLASQKPDIVVLESFGYNPIPNETTLDRHWMAMAHAVDALRASIPGVKIVIAATIAPNANVFGDGALAWNAEEKQRKVTEINSYIENAIKFAASQHLPIADAYHPSGGNTKYINAGDHIHYSDAGRALFAQAVVTALQSVL